MKAIRVVLAALLGAALALPPVAIAAKSATVTASSTQISPSLAGQGSNPLTPGFPQPSVSIPTQTTAAAPTISTATAAGSGSGLSGNSAIIIAIGAVVVLGGISFFIWRDARRRVPARARAAAAAGEGRRQGSKPRPKPRKLSPAERRRRKRGRAH